VLADLKTRGINDTLIAVVDALTGMSRRRPAPPSAKAALAALDGFETDAWGRKFPTGVAAWRGLGPRNSILHFFTFPPAIRRVMRAVSGEMAGRDEGTGALIEPRNICRRLY
jgi:transposase-like protein